MSRLILCADDFGRSANIDRAILTLVKAGKVTAVSVMAADPHLGQAATEELARLSPLIDVGLHLTLSDGDAILFHTGFAPEGRLPDIDRLTAKAFLGRLPAAAIALEVSLQFDRFFAIFGREPDFVDAHQHAHMLPGIRRIVLNAVAELSPKAWVRTCEDTFGAILDRDVSRWRALRSSLLSRGLRRAAEQHGLRTNNSFAGLYDMQGYGDYARSFPCFLRRGGEGNHLVICHPSAAPDADDPIAFARYQEFDYLQRAPVVKLATELGLQLGRFKR